LEKHKGYQRLLEEGEKSTKEKLMFKVSAKYKFLERKYWELSRLGIFIALLELFKIADVSFTFYQFLFGSTVTFVGEKTNE